MYIPRYLDAVRHDPMSRDPLWHLATIFRNHPLTYRTLWIEDERAVPPVDEDTLGEIIQRDEVLGNGSGGAIYHEDMPVTLSDADGFYWSCGRRLERM